MKPETVIQRVLAYLKANGETRSGDLPRRVGCTRTSANWAISRHRIGGCTPRIRVSGWDRVTQNQLSARVEISDLPDVPKPKAKHRSERARVAKSKRRPIYVDESTARYRQICAIDETIRRITVRTAAQPGNVFATVMTQLETKPS